MRADDSPGCLRERGGGATGGKRKTKPRSVCRFSSQPVVSLISLFLSWSSRAALYLTILRQTS